MKLPFTAKLDNKDIDLFSHGGYEELWSRDQTQPRAVSIIDPEEVRHGGQYPPVFHLDSCYAVGNWGYVDVRGDWLIKPQYLFAYPFKAGRAVVAKGKWEYRDDWEYKGKKYQGCWYESELWGVIDEQGKEIIPCKYGFIEDISHYDRPNSIVKVIEKWGEKAALLDARDGSAIVDWGVYSDFGWPMNEDEFGQLLVATGGSLEFDRNARAGVYSLNYRTELIKPQYGYVDIIDKNIFQVGEMGDDGNEKSGTLVNHLNQKLINRDDISAAIPQNVIGMGWLRQVYKITTMDHKEFLAQSEYRDGVILNRLKPIPDKKLKEENNES
jgi:hypothetical protein